MKKSKDLYALLEHDVDFSRGLIYIGSQKTSLGGAESGVDAALSEKIIKSFQIFNDLYPNGKKSLDVILNNPGGDTTHMWAIYDAIKLSVNPVKITVYGIAASAASIILQAGAERVLTPNSKLMIHSGSASLDGHVKTVERWIEEGRRQDAIVEQIYLSRIKEKHPDFKLKALRKMLEFDTILNAEEAVALGLADSIIGNK